MFLTPRWLVSHVFVIVLVGSCVAAGLWQVDRLQQRQAANALVEARIDGPRVSIDAIADLPPEDAEFQPVLASGRYEPEREILVANRVDGGSPGFWAWTVFVPESGGEVIVNRGFVNRGIVVEAEDAELFDSISAPDGFVTVSGRIRRGIVDARVSSDRSEISRPDAELAADALGLDPLLDGELYVELIAQEPAQPTGMPRPVPGPELGDGPHRSYAFQWFTFATIGTVGYVLVLLRIRRGDASRGDVASRV